METNYKPVIDAIFTVSLKVSRDFLGYPKSTHWETILEYFTPTHDYERHFNEWKSN